MADMTRSRRRPSQLRRTIVCAIAGALAASSVVARANAQIIPIRAVPIQDVDQFAFFPAANFGMGGVSIALADSLHDPFRNPALASRVKRGLYFGSPTLFSVSNRAGSGQTLPVGALLRDGAWFFGGALVAQTILPAQPGSSGFFPGPVLLDISSSPNPNGGPNEPESNHHAYGTIGRRIATHSVSIAASALWSSLSAMEGRDLLFTNSQNVRQSGDRMDVRLGVLKEWSGKRSLEAMVLHERSGMAYDVGYAQLYWDPATRQNRLQTSRESSSDNHRTLGAHVAYTMPLADSAWRLGTTLTANSSVHGRAPYPAVLGVTRDAGHSNAYSLGLGVSRSRGANVLAFDAILEPAWQRGTGRADSVTSGTLGQFAAGTRTSDSYFKFRNFVLRGGIGRDIQLAAKDSRMRLQFGAQMRNVNSTFELHDFVNGTFRATRRTWREWTHGWGANFGFPRFEFGYQLQLHSGMGRLGVPPDDDDVVFDVSRPSGVGPGGFGGPIVTSGTIFPVRAATHQLTISVPLR